MPGNIGTGFGQFSFGHAPFGTVHWATEHFDLVPEDIIREDDEEADGNLQKFTQSIAPSFEFLRGKLDGFTNLTDPNAIPIELLPFLASTHGIELEQFLSENAQRGFVRNAVKWMALKGATQGYKIRAATSGFGVSVIPLYRTPQPIEALLNSGLLFEIPPGSGSTEQQQIGVGTVSITQTIAGTLVVPFDTMIVPGSIVARKNGTGTYGTGTEVGADNSGGVITGTDLVGTVNYQTGEIELNETDQVWNVGDTVDVDYRVFGTLYTNAEPLLAFYDDNPADLLPSDTYKFEFGDSLPPGVVFKDVSSCDWCKTSKLRLLITTEDLDLQPGVSVSRALASIVSRLDDVKPAHVQIVQVAFQIELEVNVKIGVEIETFGVPTVNVPVVL